MSKIWFKVVDLSAAAILDVEEKEGLVGASGAVF
jgi:hypothetical protein